MRVFACVFMPCFLFWYVFVVAVVVRKRHNRNGNDQAAKGVGENRFSKRKNIERHRVSERLAKDITKTKLKPQLQVND